MKNFTITLIALFCAGTLLGQNYFQKYYDGVNADYWTAVQPLDNGDYIVAGFSESYGIGRHGLLAKIDSSGSVLWSKIIGNEQEFIQVVACSNGGYLVLGSTIDPTSTLEDILLVRTDSNGDTLWIKAYGDVNIHTADQPYQVIETSDHGFLVGGFTDTDLGPKNGREQFFVLKLDSMGIKQWSKIYAPNTIYNDILSDVIQTSDNGFLIAGSMRGLNGTSNYNAVLIKTDSSGNMNWFKIYGGPEQDMGWSVLQDSNGDFLLAGNTLSNGQIGFFDIFLFKLNSQGDTLWTKTYGGYGTDVVHRVLADPSGGYFLVGYTKSYNATNGDVYVIKVDSQGNVVWEKTYGSLFTEDHLSDTHYTNLFTSYSNIAKDGGLIIPSSAEIPSSLYDISAYLIKTSPNGFSGCLEQTVNSTHVGSATNFAVIDSPYIQISNQGLVARPYSTVFNDPVQLIETTVCDTVLSSPLVWPGDANSDNIANSFDLLFIGLGYGLSGPERPNASTTWTGQSCPDWSGSFYNGANHKHGDCNGDSTINEADVIPILLNYGMTHTKTSWVNKTAPSDTNLSIDFVQDSVMVGDTLVGIINFGSVPVDAYGLAFSIQYDAALVDSASATIDFSNSWLGTEGVDMITLQKDNFNFGQIDVALSRTDHQNQQGQGPIAQFSVIMIDNISGKGNLQKHFNTLITNPLALQNNGDTVDVYVSDDSTQVSVFAIDTATNHIALTSHEQFYLYPNPANQQLWVYSNATQAPLQITNIHGAVVEVRTLQKGLNEIPTHQLEKGIYLFTVASSTGTITKRVAIVR